jgi:hypothetical protein
MKCSDISGEYLLLGVQYVGLCCGNASHYLRIVAEVYGRNPPASKYSPDMSEHFIWGDKEHVDDYHYYCLIIKIVVK